MLHTPDKVAYQILEFCCLLPYLSLEAEGSQMPAVTSRAMWTLET